MRTIVLAGNPNVGKSTIFTQLSSRYAEVSNCPGTTVDMLEGRVGGDRLLDTPGIYGLSRFSEEERVALKALQAADFVVQVVDGTHLPRDLFLTWHLINGGLPLIVAVNMMDEVRRRGAFVDTARLEELLDVPVVPVSGLTGEGIKVLKALLGQSVRRSEQFRRMDGPASLASPLDVLLWTEEDAELLKQAGASPTQGSRTARYRDRRRLADQTASEVFLPPRRPDGMGRTVGDWLLTPLGATAVGIFVLLLAYYGIGVVVAGQVVSFLEQFMTRAVVPLLAGAVAHVLPVHSIGYRLLMGPYGLISAGLIDVLALLLPLIVACYLLLAALEDSGCLPRLATMLDRFFWRLGLNGRAVIPWVLGSGWTAMAARSTRKLSSERERTIATVVSAWTIPGSTQLGVITGLLAGLGWRYAMTYALIMVGLFIAAGTLLEQTRPGRPKPLLLELPPLRWPSPMNVIEKTRMKVSRFLGGSAPLFLLGSGSVEMMQVTGVLPWLAAKAGPFMEAWLGVPGSAVPAFILGLVRRDFGAVGLYASGLDARQVLTGVVTLTLSVPCIAFTRVIFKERGARHGTVAWLGSIALALVMGALTARLGLV